MDIRILGWQSSGLRCPDMKVELSRSEGLPSIHLIQMPNGTGKTTTLSLISACLSGSASFWSEEQILDYRRLDASSDEGRFVLNLQVGSALVGFELVFDFFQRTCRYRTSNPEQGGVRDGWKPLPILKRYFNKDFVKMVVFDGELASRLLDPTHTQAERAIDALCQLDFFTQMKNSSDHLWRNAKLEGALDEGQIQQIKRRIDKVRAERDRYFADIEKAKKHLAGLAKRKSELESSKTEELNRHAELKETYNAAERKVEAARRNLDQSMTMLFESFRNPMKSFPRVQAGLLRFKEGLDKARLPESTSRRFFEEIVEAETCICGTPFNEPMRDQIREKMGEYLSDESTGVLNLLKDSISKHSESPPPDSSGYESTLIALRTSFKEYLTSEQEKDIAKLGYSGPGAEELSRIEQEIGGIIKEIESFEGILESRVPLHKQKQDELETLEDELAEAQNSRSLKTQVSILEQICNDTIREVRAKVKALLLEQCNEDIPLVLRDNPVQIGKIDGAISLVNQTAASVGQTLAVGYVFLSRLFSYAAHSFPFVVDSPVGPLDNSVREQVGALIPKLNRQFIAFTISSEREGFINGLESNGAGMVQFTTIHRSESDINTATVASGREAFFSFHSNKD